jgi:DNA primase
VVFPIRDRQSTLVAASGRYIDGRDNPKTRTTGTKSAGVFSAPARAQSTLPSSRLVFASFDKGATEIIICEAPLDALSLATAGYPAIALCGTSAPAWIHLACGLKRVLLAFDADAAGDQAAATLAPLLSSFGARVHRLRPEGGKDWNEFLQIYGRDALTDFLAVPVLREE